jgi:alpha-N-arabinofuranosidase
MTERTRRAFIGGTAAGVAGSLLARYAPARAQQSDSRLEILVHEPIGTIAPEIYGHFVEHLGGVVYDGIWDATLRGAAGSVTHRLPAASVTRLQLSLG